MLDGFRPKLNSLQNIRCTLPGLNLIKNHSVVVRRCDTWRNRYCHNIMFSFYALCAKNRVTRLERCSLYRSTEFILPVWHSECSYFYMHVCTYVCMYVRTCRHAYKSRSIQNAKLIRWTLYFDTDCTFPILLLCSLQSAWNENIMYVRTYVCMYVCMYIGMYVTYMLRYIQIKRVNCLKW
jgi:hypothetical protein